IDCRNRADTARRRPGARAGVVRRRNPLAALDQRPHLATAIDYRLETLEHKQLLRIPSCALIVPGARNARPRSEEHTSELQSLMRISYAVFCLKKKNKNK